MTLTPSNARHLPPPSAPMPIRRSAVAILAGDIVDLLRDAGPLNAAELRRRLGVASRDRFMAAVLLVKEDGTVEQVREVNEITLRVVGDRRPVPMSMTSLIAKAASLRGTA